jgi:nicotinamide-nucleotide amidase
MQAEIVIIGTEILLGEIIDTNAALLAKMLREIGIDLFYKTTVGDNEDRITEVLDRALDRADVVITSGGLGPTADDVTRQAVARATGRRLVYSTKLEAQIAARFRSFGRTMTENNNQQAFLPEGALPLPNPVGTAPCFLSGDTGGRGFIVSLPGVPRELEHMMTHTVMPLLVERMGGKKILKVRILRTCAVGESNIDRAIRHLMTAANPTVGLSAHAGQTDVRITAKADNEQQAQALIAPVEAALREALGVAIYGEDDQSVAEVVGRLVLDKDLGLGVLDTVTDGQLAAELRAAGFGETIKRDLHPHTLEEIAGVEGLDIGGTQFPETATHGAALAAALASGVAPERGVGLSLVGPFSDDVVVVAVHGPGQLRLSRTMRGSRREPEYRRRWMIVQGLDWIRRAVLGELESPVDWRPSTDSSPGSRDQTHSAQTS